jgi:hypothetical protein
VPESETIARAKIMKMNKLGIGASVLAMGLMTSGSAIT